MALPNSRLPSIQTSNLDQTTHLPPSESQDSTQSQQFLTPSQSTDTNPAFLTPTTPTRGRQQVDQRDENSVTTPTSNSPIGARITPVRSNSTSRFHEHISSGEESDGKSRSKSKGATVAPGGEQDAGPAREDGSALGSAAQAGSRNDGARQVQHQSAKGTAAGSTTIDASRRSDSSWERVDRPSMEGFSQVKQPETQTAAGSSRSVRDPLLEPRRTIPKRRIENQRGKAFGAPIFRSGVVTQESGSLRKWLLPGPIGVNSLQGGYLLIAHCIGAALISGAINFGIGVATYINQPAIHIWKFNPITLAGDMGLTIILQQIITMLITSMMVHRDLEVGPLVGPFREPWPPLLNLPSTPDASGNYFGSKTKQEVKEHRLEPLPMGDRVSPSDSTLKRWFYFILRSTFTGSERNDILCSGLSPTTRFQRIFWTALQGFFLSVMTFWWYWPISVGIVYSLYGGEKEHILVGSYRAPIVKLIYGGVLSALTNPLLAMLAMGSEFQVRRCYPEAEVWREVGGEEDTLEWRRELGVEKEEGRVEGA